MIISSIHIEQFGNFHDYDISFTAGLTAFIQENGWGKSTLASFIKAMLYGLDEKGRSKHFTDRERYFPWNGSTCGGSLVFSYCGKEYKITRSFDSKKKQNDTCSVIEAVSKCPAEVFLQNPDTIGVTLFGLDKESFERSCFITLDPEKLPVQNDNITAKLNNLIEDADDVANFQNADAQLKAKINSITGRGEAARLVRLDDEIKQLKSRIDSLTAIESHIQEKYQLLEAEELRKAECTRMLQSLETEQTNSIRYDKKKIYDSMLHKITQLEQEESTITAFFNNRVPDDSVIQNIVRKKNDYQHACSDRDRNTVSDDDRRVFSDIAVFFSGQIPSAADIDACQQNINKKKSFDQAAASHQLDSFEQEKLHTLKKTFSAMDISDEILQQKKELLTSIQDMRRRRQQTAEQYEAARIAERQEREDGAKRRMHSIFCFAGFVAGAAGASVLLTALRSIPYAVPAAFALCAGAVLSGIAGIRLTFTKKSGSTAHAECERLQTAITAADAEITSAEQLCLSFAAHVKPDVTMDSAAFVIAEIAADYTRYKELLAKESDNNSFTAAHADIDGITSAISAFTARYQVSCGTSNADDIIQIVRNKLSSYTALSQTIQIHDAAERTAEECRRDLKEWLSAYNVNATEPYEAQIQSVQDNYQQLHIIRKSRADEERQYQDFAQANDIEQIKQAVPTEKTTEDINAQIHRVQDTLQQIMTHITMYTNTIENDTLQIDCRGDYENQLQQKEAQYAVCKKDAEIYTQARDLLTEAKNNLSNRYMQKMESAFKTYMTQLAGTAKISINRELGVAIEPGTGIYGREHLSEGYKDVVNFCTRMALIDAMFESEPPVVILDDPFINLDADKIDAAKRILCEAAKKEQIIYFACHDSRGLY